MAVIDAANQLIPAGVISSTQDFTPIPCAPRSFGPSAWLINVTVPPAAAVTFTLSVASTQGGAYTVCNRFAWPAGVSGSKSVQIGFGGNAAHVLNNTAAWMRASVTLTGPLTLGGSWLTQASDGGPGLGSRSYSLDNINQL